MPLHLTQFVSLDPHNASAIAETHESDISSLGNPECRYNLVPAFDGALFIQEWKDALWDRFYTGAPKLGRKGIRINAIMPGFIHSAQTAPIVAMNGAREAILARIPVGRIGEPDDIAALTAFLASDDAGFITGQNFPVDGGMSPNVVFDFPKG